VKGFVVDREEMAAFRNPLLAGFGSDHYICHAVLTRPREMGQSAVLRGQRILCYVGITRHAVPTPCRYLLCLFAQLQFRDFRIHHIRICTGRNLIHVFLADV
jgi:hypothetical protein